MNGLQRVAAFRDVMASIGAKLHVMPQTTQEAMEIAQEIEHAAIQNAEKALAAVKSFNALVVSEVPKDDFAALAKYVDGLKRAEVDFWDAFEGQVVDGVRIVRRFV